MTKLLINQQTIKLIKSDYQIIKTCSKSHQAKKHR